ncbi:hypothetical protein CI109_100844 [Kwoniella shandongensis]|uniref:Uncharacterized protein n=1 Tax=Kwoniella shandongensis TaxID=1734106 RepID=A0A5M6BRV3_9TREE|nr:uncharacterized protein CI109_006096 [Kwoniella shandongensis]KAA5525523.1 hypothetical protein CI109_006096 [Kwoniella shandongensis]
MLVRAAFPAFFFTLGAFILLLLVTLSVPIIKTIYLLHITNSGSSGALAANAGVFGMCYNGGQASILGIEYSNNAACTHPKVGYTFDDAFVGTTADFAGLSNTVVKGLAGSLVINAIACGFAGLSLINAFLAWFCASRVFEIFTFFSLGTSTFAAWLAFAMDLALALVARSRIDNYTNGAFVGHIGNAVWLTLAAAVALSLAIILAGCGMFGRYRSQYTNPNTGSGNAFRPHRAHRWGSSTRTNAGTY